MAVRWVVSAYVGLILAHVGPMLGRCWARLSNVGPGYLDTFWAALAPYLAHFEQFLVIFWYLLAFILDLGISWLLRFRLVGLFVFDFGHLKIVGSWPCRLYFGLGDCILGLCKAFAKKRSKHKERKIAVLLMLFMLCLTMFARCFSWLRWHLDCDFGDVWCLDVTSIHNIRQSCTLVANDISSAFPVLTGGA